MLTHINLRHYFKKGLCYGFLLSAIAMITDSCDKFITVPSPVTELVMENVFYEDKTAIAAISGIYNSMSHALSFASGGSQSLTLCTGLYADELVSFSLSNSSSQVVPFYFNHVVPTNGVVASTWQNCYSLIYAANRLIEGLHSSNAITLTVKRQLLGEALFIRAFCHFYLVNLFGDVPLITVTDYRTNAAVIRTPSTLVYERIISDLLDAKQLLSDQYPSVGRVRPNKGAAAALLARVYLYIKDYENAEVQSTEVIGNTGQYNLVADLNKVFLINSTEAIWQLLPNGGENNYTYEGSIFILVSAPTTCALRTTLFEAFETGDLRRHHWVGTLTSSSGLTNWYYPYKYKERQSNATGSECSMVMRLAEQYLIRAEARAQLGKIFESQTDINTIRHRASLSATKGSTREELLSAIEHERRVELFTEFGHRFFDLKRTERLDAVMSVAKSNWMTFNASLPLPQSEIVANNNLIQNFGY